jgi:putative transposase
MGEKKVNGRKRHILVDVLGLLIKVVVHAADEADNKGAKHVLANIKAKHPRLERIWVDGA